MLSPYVLVIVVSGNDLFCFYVTPNGVRTSNIVFIGDVGKYNKKKLDTPPTSLLLEINVQTI